MRFPGFPLHAKVNGSKIFPTMSRNLLSDSNSTDETSAFRQSADGPLPSRRPTTLAPEEAGKDERN